MGSCWEESKLEVLEEIWKILVGFEEEAGVGVGLDVGSEVCCGVPGIKVTSGPGSEL